MPRLPTGTVTFLFTDIEGSTRLLQQLGDRYPDVLEAHRRLLRAATEQAGGCEFETQGDGLFVAFQSARDALVAAVTAQRALNAYPWPERAPVRVRMGLHTGHPTVTGSGYVGIDLHRTARICAVSHGGQVLLSETTRDLVADDLPEDASLRDMGQHRLKDLTRPQRLFQIVVGDLPGDFPPLKSLETLPNNLPIQLTSFIGRKREMAEIKKLLSTTHLLTLTGAGGCGKTRLALQVAAEMLDEFNEGVWLIELATLSDQSLVPQTVASTLGVREEPGRPLVETLVDFLRSKSLLLLLDNCEHVLFACAELADVLLHACSNLRVLATSREALGIAGETAFRIPSLPLPDAATLPLTHLAHVEAVQLFVDRATAALPTFNVDAQNARAVATICHGLDGIPLAIELAAARVTALSVEHIAARLEDRFRLLTGGSRTAVPRHQTLRRALDWSFALLSELEKAVLRRLSVFAGGFTLEAAEAVCLGQGVDAADVVDVLTHLVDKSLVVFQDREGRYRLLETVRQYGRDRLLESGEAADVRRRHRDVFLALTQEAEPMLRGPDQLIWLNRLEADYDNLRAALEWSRTDTEDGEVMLRFVGHLGWFWSRRAYLSEGRAWLQSVLALADGLRHTPGWARAAHADGVLAWLQGDYGSARSMAEESVAIFREVGDKVGLGDSLRNLGMILVAQDDSVGAHAPLKESLGIFEEIGDRWSLALSLVCLGVATIEVGNYTEARPLLEKSLAIFRETGDKWAIALPLNNLGQVAYREGDYGTALSRFEESLALWREVGDRRMIIVSLGHLGQVARDHGDHARARAIYEERLALSRDLGVKRSIAYSLMGLGVVERLEGDSRQSRAHLEECRALLYSNNWDPSGALSSFWKGWRQWQPRRMSRSGRHDSSDEQRPFAKPAVIRRRPSFLPSMSVL